MPYLAFQPMAPGWYSSEVDETVTKVGQFFFEQGVLGVVVLVAFFAIWKLWQKNNELQEKCLELALKVTETVDTVTASLERNTEIIDRLERRETKP